MTAIFNSTERPASPPSAPRVAGTLALAGLLVLSVMSPSPAAAQAEPDTEYGLGVRGGLMAVPQGVYEAFVERASSGTSRAGFGAELVRRRGDFEVAFAVGYDQLSPEDGLWLEDGDTPPEGTPYLMEFEDLGWVTVGPTFTWHTPLGDAERVALRYGAGVGVAIMTGDAFRTSTECESEALASCEPITDPEDGRLRDPITIPSVLPLASLVAGLQFRLHPRANLNLEAGFRTVGYAGGGLTVFF